MVLLVIAPHRTKMVHAVPFAPLCQVYDCDQANTYVTPRQKHVLYATEALQIEMLATADSFGDPWIEETTPAELKETLKLVAERKPKLPELANCIGSFDGLEADLALIGSPYRGITVRVQVWHLFEPLPRTLN
mmetsp:Transcript_35867/g.143341  ORF Transcript_35867/g.143341 Transcript_35867/m.143341 type:complete len:133 (-) Transcript_35867:986-1384(-)